MKTSRILVGKDGYQFPLTSGEKVVAVCPPGKGEKTAYLLLANGKFSPLKNARINGLSVARYFTENGFELAKPGDESAARMADLLDVREGTTLVEARSRAYAGVLSEKFANQTCTYVPFDESQPTAQVTVEASRGICSVAYDLVSGISSGVVRIDHQTAPSSIGMDIQLSKGWLVGPTGTPAAMPRNTEYGGVVEHAVFVICNSGLGELVGNKNLAMDENCALDDPFPKGKLVVRLTSGDLLTVGIDALDEVTVQYLRDGAVLYERNRALGGTNALRLGSVIGAIAAVLVRVQELDAVPVKASRTRAQKAA